MKHKLISTHSIDSLINEIDINIKKNFYPTLVFIYLSVAYDLELLLKKLKKYKFIVIGSTTVGEIYADAQKGVVTTNKSIVCILTNLNQSAFKIKVKSLNDDTHMKFGKNIGKWVSKSFSNSALLTLTSGLMFNNESYINGIQKKIKFFFGAVAGDDRIFNKTYIFSNKKIISNGVLALAIDLDKVELITSRGFGWSGIGTQRVVTKSDENLVYTIDDKSAVAFYNDYLNIKPSEVLTRGGDYPMEVLLENGQIVYRAPLSFNEDGSLLFAGHVPKGAKVRISAPIGELVVDKVKESIEKSLIKKESYTADLVLVFPCASRKELLGSFGVNEIKAVHEITKQSPLIGFYAYGEISSSSQSNAFHNQTFVTAQLREKR